jgi:hypothetical protein
MSKRLSIVVIALETRDQSLSAEERSRDCGTRDLFEYRSSRLTAMFGRDPDDNRNSICHRNRRLSIAVDSCHVVSDDRLLRRVVSFPNRN